MSQSPTSRRKQTPKPEHIKKKSKTKSCGETVKCKDCSKKLVDGTKAMACDYCQKWLCIHCLDVSEELYDSLVRNPAPRLMLPCKDCMETANSWKTMNDTLKVLKESQEKTAKNFEKFEHNWESFKKDLKITISETVKEEVERNLKEKVDLRISQLEDKLTQDIIDLQYSVEQNNKEHASPQSDVNDLVKLAVKEQLQKEKKKFNLVLYKVTESNSKFRQSRVNHDKEMVDKIAKFILETEDSIKNQIVSVARLGKFTPGKIRPLRVIFKNTNVKFDLLSAAYKLKNCNEEPINIVRLTLDRTQMEVESYRKVLEDFQQRKAKGEQVTMKRGQIVQIDDSSQNNKSTRKVDSPAEDMVDNSSLETGNNATPSETDYESVESNETGSFSEDTETASTSIKIDDKETDTTSNKIINKYDETNGKNLKGSKPRSANQESRINVNSQGKSKLAIPQAVTTNQQVPDQHL